MNARNTVLVTTMRIRSIFFRYRNGKEIYSDSRIKITRDAQRIEDYSLTLTLIQSEDGGEYEVRATNEQGSAVTKSLISVLSKFYRDTYVRFSSTSKMLVPVSILHFEFVIPSICVV